MPMETARVLYKEKPGHGTRMLSPGLHRTLIARSMAWLQPLVKITSCKRGWVHLIFKSIINCTIHVSNTYTIHLLLFNLIKSQVMFETCNLMFYSQMTSAEPLSFPNNVVTMHLIGFRCRLKNGVSKGKEVCSKWAPLLPVGPQGSCKSWLLPSGSSDNLPPGQQIYIS